MRRRFTPLRWITRSFSHFAGFLAARFMLYGLHNLRYRTVCRLGRVAGRLVWSWSVRERQRTLHHLERAYPNRSRRWRGIVGRRVFEQIGYCGLATAYTALVDFSHFEEAVKGDEWMAYVESKTSERGAVLVVPHMGMFLLSAGWGPRTLPFEAMARPVRLEYGADLAETVFRGIGFETHAQGTPLRALARRIREGVTVAMVADHDVRRIGGAFVPFFGQLAYTPTGPVALAMLARTEVVVALTVPTARRRSTRTPRYETRIERIEMQHSGERDIDLAENTRRWLSVMESYIRAYPEEWSWMNRRWRTRPHDRPRAPIWRPDYNRTGWEVAPVRVGGQV